MKGFIFSLMLLLAATVVSATVPDTVFTSFEIHLKKKSENYSLAFNSCSIDRSKLYNTVMQKLQKRMQAKNFRSLDGHMVSLQYDEYVARKPKHQVLAPYHQRMLKQHPNARFIRVVGNLNPNTPLNPFRKAVFTLSVFVYDSQGNLIARSKAKSETVPGADMYKSKTQITEQGFIELVAQSAEKINLSI